MKTLREDEDLRGVSVAARTLTDRKRQVIKKAIKGAVKKLKGGDTFNPEPEIDETDTMVKV